LTQAIHDGFSDARALKEAMADYQRLRDEHGGPMYELTCRGLASFEPPPLEMLAPYQALRSLREANLRRNIQRGPDERDIDIAVVNATALMASGFIHQKRFLEHSDCVQCSAGSALLLFAVSYARRTGLLRSNRNSSADAGVQPAIIARFTPIHLRQDDGGIYAVAIPQGDIHK
jgi:hypothetical protein